MSVPDLTGDVLRPVPGGGPGDWAPVGGLVEPPRDCGGLWHSWREAPWQSWALRLHLDRWVRPVVGAYSSVGKPWRAARQHFHSGRT
jgi:hypothetical protein